MKHKLITTLAFSIALSTVSVFADSREVVVPYAPSITTVSHVEEREGSDSSYEKTDRKYRGANTASTTLARIKANGDRLIAERLNSLASNKQVILSAKGLTADQKASIVSTIDTNVTGLTTLRSSIAAGVDATSTKALVSSVYSSYRIYGIVIPQVRLEKRVYDLQNHSVKLSDTFLKIQSRIDEAKTKGKDVTVWQKALDDAKILVANDMNTLAQSLVKVKALKPADYGTTTKATIESINKDLKLVAKDFSTIGKLVRMPALKAARKVVGTGTSTSPLFGTSWTWVSTTEGATTTTAKSDKFVLSFGEDNRLNSATDCNTLNGVYTINGNAFSVGPLMMTMMYCDGSQEGVYSASLSKTSAYSVTGQTLSLTSSSGVMTFSKKN